MPARIEPLGEFLEWLDGLTKAEQDAVDRYIGLLRQLGVTLKHPYSSSIRGAKFPLRELRPTAGRSELRVFYAFDPEQAAVLLIGGCKTGVNQKKFYEQYILRSKGLWRRHITGLLTRETDNGPLGSRKAQEIQRNKNRQK
jgi:hypothetical protein